LKNTGLSNVLKITNWWTKLKKAGKKHGKANNSPQWFDEMMSKVENMHPAIRKMRFFMFCKYKITM
jgi:hypothetical protein